MYLNIHHTSPPKGCHLITKSKLGLSEVGAKVDSDVMDLS
jgi:hypothetical protein